MTTERETASSVTLLSGVQAPFRAFRKQGQTCLLTCDLLLPSAP